MGRIRVLSDNVANKIAAGEVVERPASVVKELLENSLDAGATRIRIEVEAGGRKLIAIMDNGCGMGQDDAMLAFERHATSKIHDADDLLNIDTLGFRGEALPSIASVSRLALETRQDADTSGTRIEIAGGKLLKVEETGAPAGTAITVRDLFFNTPARKKFLKAESTELSHIASLVTHYALAHPDKHLELHSATHNILTASPVATHAERLYQIFGRDTLDQLISVAAESDLERVGIPEPPPWRRTADYEPPTPGKVRLRGFVSKPELQKLNRNSIFVFVNQRLVRDRLVQHALTEAYRNIIPPTVFPVVLLFLEMPPTEVDANVHPAKTEVRFRQQGFVHDFVRDSVRAALMKARPVPQFTREISAQPTAAVALSPGASLRGEAQDEAAGFVLTATAPPAQTAPLAFDNAFVIQSSPGARSEIAAITAAVPNWESVSGGSACSAVIDDRAEVEEGVVPQLASLRPLGQIRESFILAVDQEGLWIIDQHVAHERVLFERVLIQRQTESIPVQKMLMPIVVQLTPGQQAVFAEISDELGRNGFEVELFGSRTVVVKAVPAGIESCDMEQMLSELLGDFEREQQMLNLDAIRHRIAASIACHAAIKVNMPLEQNKMEWLLRELAQTECPMSCPHGRPVVLRYSVKDIQRAFKRI
ncbi:MAG TPA: DNA mismatch repair endonuclease MutL [Terriglobales bacterium]|jgi:DNA mismatch repair protein MutL|nr:DNA mismatch repair endonuclease MutL [Terriglobales bacterium]